MHFKWPVGKAEKYDGQNCSWGHWGHRRANCWHCFTEDWRFERIWRNPEASLKDALELKYVVAPDYTFYRESTREVALWQLFRSAQITGFWMANGVNVIPCLMWNDKLYPEEIAEAIGTNGVYAVRGPGREYEKYWMEFAERLVGALKPEQVLHFGNPMGLNVWGEGVGVRVVLRQKKITTG
jgi:hypothetical protein